MRIYADSSFILRLVTKEPGSEPAIAEYRRLAHPSMFFLPLHELEVSNAIFQRAFHQRHSLASGARQQVARERDAALARLKHFRSHHALLDVMVNLDTALARATKMSIAHTERLGTRAIDLFHVACALALESDLFLTTDARQARLATLEGLKVTFLK